MVVVLSEVIVVDRFVICREYLRIPTVDVSYESSNDRILGLAGVCSHIPYYLGLVICLWWWM